MHLHCTACGKRFSSYGAEARHRHNFPVYCSRNKRFKQWEEEMAKLHPPINQA
jgi:hypothetical protein